MERAVPFSWSLALALAIAGCSLPRAALGTPDGGGIDAFTILLDASVLDVGPRDDTGLDAFAFDMGSDAFVAPLDTGNDAFIAPVDMGMDAFVAPDMGQDAYVPPVDAYVAPDVFGDASTPCDRAYGGSDGYVACPSASASTTCVFYVNWPGASSGSCNDRCGAARCVSAIGNRDGSQCSNDGNGTFPCSQTFQDAICTCTP